MNSLITGLADVLVLIALFGLAIFVHELGHFIAARWCGMVVEVFSIGFGPAIWKKKINGITYKIFLWADTWLCHNLTQAGCPRSKAKRPM